LRRDEAGKPLAQAIAVDSASVMRAAIELYRAREYPGVAVVCADALDHDPDNLHLRLLRAKALLALRNDFEAQDELAECVRRDQSCVAAFRLLGELGVRRDQPESAEVFLREALRLDPQDHEAEEWLRLALNMTRRSRQVAGTARPPFRPATVAEKLPAAAAVAGHFVPSPAPATSALPVASGFGVYLRDIGVLTEAQLRAALAYKRATGVRLGRAVTTLGFASELKIEWASLAYHGRHRLIY
jgi:tetratricopeptide (TPR) repeat protein